MTSRQFHRWKLVLTGHYLANKSHCYIASTQTKYNWLICGHMDLNTCYAYMWGNKWKIVARFYWLRM